MDTADLRAGGGKVSPKKSPLQVRTNVFSRRARGAEGAIADLNCLPQAKMEVWSPRAVTQEEVDQQQAAASARKEVRHTCPITLRSEQPSLQLGRLLSRPSSCC